MEDNGDSVPNGTVVTARKWIVDHSDTAPLMYSAFSRPFTDDAHNSNVYFVDNGYDGIFIAVADGLEHGVKGHAVAKKAIECARRNRKLEFDDILLKVHKALGKKQKAAVTLVNIKFNDRVIKYAGAGNIKARICHPDEKMLLPDKGILGGDHLPLIKLNHAYWPDDGILVVSSEGLADWWDIKEIPGYRDYQVTMLNNLLIREYIQKNRDATVVVVKEKADTGKRKDKRETSRRGERERK